MKTIIAATDFSPEAENAVKYAADVALQLKAKLIIFNDVSLEPAWSEYPTPQDVYEAAIDGAKNLLAETERSIKERTAGIIDIETRFNIGSVNNELQSLCDKEKPIAVFIATHATSGLERFVFGSHAISLAKRNAFPVVIIPTPTPDFSGLKKIALALDLKNPGDISWDFLRAWLKNFDPQLDIVYIDKAKQTNAGSLPATITVEQQLECFQPQFHIISNEKVEDGIKEYVEKNKPDLLIVHPKKHGLFHKSESNAFILHPPVPLMTLTDNGYANEEAVAATQKLQKED
ncbi:MAG TPA: universal stress protein [Arachidicoccus sp.]